MIFDLIPSRAVKKEKEIFYQQLNQKFHGFIKDKNKNIIDGCLLEASDILICAHYDTKINSIFELLQSLINKNKLYLLIKIEIVMISLVWGLLSIYFSFFIYMKFNWNAIALMFLFFATLVIPFLPIKINSSNLNDNTSGIILALQFFRKKGCSIILFDKEEFGLQGSKKFVKTNRDVLKNKLIINLDTVGSGEYIVLSAFNQMEKIANLLANNKKYPNIILASDNIKRKGDHWSFREYNCIGISRADKDSKGRLYAKNIHTKYDDENNISQEKLDEVEELVKDVIELWSELK